MHDILNNFGGKQPSVIHSKSKMENRVRTFMDRNFFFHRLTSDLDDLNVTVKHISNFPQFSV